MAEPKAYKQLGYWVVPVTFHVQGRLHATSPSTEAGQAYALERNQPSDTNLERRRLAGEPIIPMDELARALAEEVPPEEVSLQVSRWRRDAQGRPFIHSNFIKGHLRDAADVVGRAVGFWGLKNFISTTLFISPYATYFPQGTILGEDKWPTHFDIYRRGRLASFRKAECAESPILSVTIVLIKDPHWTKELLEAILLQGGIMGMGGGRRLDMGKYTATMGGFETAEPRIAQDLIVSSTVMMAAHKEAPEAHRG